MSNWMSSGEANGTGGDVGQRGRCPTKRFDTAFKEVGNEIRHGRNADVWSNSRCLLSKYDIHIK